MKSCKNRSDVKLERSGLTLGRKQWESIKIYDPLDGSFVPIVITHISPGRSSVHIAAPPHLKIVRTELAEKPAAITAETQPSAEAS